MKVFFASVLLLPLAFVALPAGAGATVHAATAAVPAPRPQAALRGLWQGHVSHTRDYAMAVHAGDTRRAEAAVIANAKDLANAVGGFNGAAAGAHQLDLLAAHWGGVKALTTAAQRKDAAAEAKAFAALTANAREIATFLSGANPHLPFDAVNGMLVAHAGHHPAQVHAVMRADRKAEAAATTAMRSHMDAVADAMAGALARQFPKKAAWCRRCADWVRRSRRCCATCCAIPTAAMSNRCAWPCA
jgi:hypothetical protein